MTSEKPFKNSLNIWKLKLAKDKTSTLNISRLLVYDPSENIDSFNYFNTFDSFYVLFFII